MDDLAEVMARNYANPAGYTMADLWEESADAFGTETCMIYVGCKESVCAVALALTA